MSDVTTVGSVNIDLTSYLERWPQIGETVRTKKTLISLGGKGANQAVAAARMDANTTFIGAIGTDAFGADVERHLLANLVAVRLFSDQSKSTGMAFIDVGPDGNNIIRINPGANGSLTAQTIEDNSHLISKSKIVLLQNEIPLAASVRASKIARASGVLVMMDPAPAPVPFWPSQVLSDFDILTPNSQETAMITGHEPRTLGEAEEAAIKLKEFGAKNSIVTMGKLGIAWNINGNAGRMQPPPVDTIDTVGAGDCFNGTFAAAYVAGNSIDVSLGVAVHAAAISTTRKGAADSLPTKIELRSIMALYK